MAAIPPGKRNLPKKTKAVDDSHPFGMPWLDSCYQETILPNGPWHQKVNPKLCEAFSKKIEKQFNNAHRKQMILELLGQDFVHKYFSQEEYKPQILLQPEMEPELRKKLQIDAQNWLQNTLNKVATETGCQRAPIATENGETLSPEMEEFLQHTHNNFTKGLNRHLFLQEKEVINTWKELQWESKKDKENLKESRDRERLRMEHDRLTGGVSGVRSILKVVPPSTAQSAVSNASEKPPTTANIKGALYGNSEDPPVFWGMQSNSLGRSVIGILKRDPRRFNEVAVRLHGRQLPGSLRTYIWLDVLFRVEREKVQDVNVEKVIREKFGRAVARGLGEMKIKRPTHSPISGLVDNAVIETYDATPAMRMYMSDDAYMKESAKALNVLYVYDRTYEPYLIFWLFPLQLAFQEHQEESEHVYELAMYLDLLNQGCFPRWPQIFATAKRAMERLRIVDPDFHDHLKAVAQINPNINPKEFLVHLIHEEESKAVALMVTDPKVAAEKSSQDILADPLMFIRKWMGEAFVGVLDTQAAVFIWDQCFLQKWNPLAFEDTCLALLLLLRHHFLQTSDYATMKEVFLNEPCKLYTKDIQRAWIHLQGKGHLKEVPAMNRQRPKTPEPVATPSVPQDQTSPARAPTKSPTPSVSSLSPLSPIGLKELRLEIAIPVDSIQRERWLVDFKPTNLKLLCTIYFGSVKLRSKPSTVAPVSIGVVTDKYGNKTYKAEFPDEKLIFEDIDLSQYDVEREMGGYPFAILRVDYTHQDNKGGKGRISAPVTLGWARIRLFTHRSELSQRPEPIHGNNQWILTSTEGWYTIHAGMVSEGLVGNASPANDYGLIGGSSRLGVQVYDPRDDPSRPRPQPRRTPQPGPAAQSPAQNTPAPPSTEPEPQPSSTEPEPSPVVDRTPTPPLDSEKPGLSDTFDLYIDCLQNIPDNATIIKVTGRVVKTGQLGTLTDILALPELTTSARSPRFKYRFTLNEEKLTTDVSLTALLRVYTVDADSKELVVIGSCLMELYDKKKKLLKVGNYKRGLHYGMPDLSKGIDVISETSLDAHPRIPGCVICLRLMAHKEDYVPCPPLDSKQYQMYRKPFNQSEKNVINSFNNDQLFPKTVKDMVQHLQELENTPQDERAEMTEWLQDRLDNKKHLPANEPAGNLELSRLVRYRIEVGVKAQIIKAYGLPEGSYIQCFARVVPGRAAMQLPVTTDGYGRDDKFITLKHDYTSLQKSPKWKDDPAVLHLHGDPQSALIVQVFGVDPVYTPTPDHSAPGVVTDKRGQPLALGDDTVLGWAVLPVFDHQYVLNGEIHAPIFKGKPDQQIMEEFLDKPPDEVIRARKWDANSKYEGAAVVLNIWDAHFDKLELVEKYTRLDFMLEATGKKDPYLKAEKDAKGKKISDLVIKSLAKKDQKNGVKNPVYLQEEPLYEKAMSGTFYNLMESALMDAGYGPL